MKPKRNKFSSHSSFVAHRQAAAALLIIALLLATATPAFAADDATTDAGELGNIIITIAKWVLDILVVVAFALMAVGVATGFVSGQLLTTLGAPHGVSSAMMRVIAVIGCGVGAFLTVTIINAVLELVGGFAISNDLQMPGTGGEGGDTGRILEGLITTLAWARYRFLPF